MEKFTYLREGGKRCPECGNDILDKGQIREHPLFLYREVRCVAKECGFHFVEEFVLSDIKILKIQT